ncbi:MAG: cation:proton antiporter [Marmoricola sp.]|nr:cation:proton antiporter [Marmoricola sp.]
MTVRTRENGRVTFAELSLICLVGLAGPLLAAPRRLLIPIVVGELLAGLVIGRTGFAIVDAGDPTFTFLADIGFALMMFVVGTHVPLRDPALRSALRPALFRVLGTAVLAGVAGWALATAVGTDHAALYAVLMASSSAAVVLPVLDGLRGSGSGTGRGAGVVGLLPQIALADAACIVALPIVIDRDHVLRAALGALAMIAATVVVFLVLRSAERRGVRKRLHDVSEDRRFAAELRIQLTILFALAGLAVWLHVSVLLAGFGFGLAVAAIGEPRRLARQLFALTEGFAGPVFFVWLGATLDLSALGSDPKLILLGVGLGLGAGLVHLVWVLAGQPFSMALLASAQLGVPVAAATIGQQLGVLGAGEAAALLLGALITIGLVVVGAGLADRGRAPQT